MSPSPPELGEVELRLRRDALTIFRAALAAVEPESLVRNALEARQGGAPSTDGRLIVFAVGKAAVPMARGAASLLGDRIGDGVLLTPAGSGGRAPEGFRVFRGAHPLPDQEGLEGARHVREVARRAGPSDRILLLLSGGGSALLTLPDAEVSLDDVRRVTERLMLAGASIQELNTVRKHLETLKGGRLAALAAPAPLEALILSDVVGDPLDVIASGPVSPDPTTFADAITVLEARDIWGEVPEPVRAHLLYGREGQVGETPKPGDAVFSGVHVRVIGNAALAARRAAEEAARLGYESVVDSSVVTGEARDVGATLGERAISLLRSGQPACAVSAGETTVVVRGNGRGGRNQELALAAAPRLEGRESVLVFSGGTDGLDGPTDAAGALATGTTAARARALALDPAAHLERNDAYTFFEALGDLVKTGPTGTNVMDLMLAMAAGSAEPALGVLSRREVRSTAPAARPLAGSAARGPRPAPPGAPACCTIPRPAVRSRSAADRSSARGSCS